MSTADSFLLVPGDEPDARRRAAIQAHHEGAYRRADGVRGWVLLLGCVAYLLVDRFPTILTAAYTAYLVYGTGITPALLAAFLWKRATAQGAARVPS